MFFTDLRYAKKNELICVMDGLEFTGNFIVKDFLKGNVENGNHVRVISFDVPALKLRQQLYDDSQIQYVDGCAGDDPLDLIKEILPWDGKLILVIYSLTTLTLEHDFNTVYRGLNILLHKKFPNAKIQILAVIHADVPKSVKELKHWFYLSNIWMEVNLKLVTVTTKRSNGKHDIQKFDYLLNKKGEVVEKKKAKEALNEKKNDLEPVSTFRLSLTQDQMEARSNVELPYLKSRYEEFKTEPEIFVEPDEFDDWDEEEADNDLYLQMN